MANAYYNNTRSFTPGTAADGNAVDDKFDGVASGLDSVDVAVQRAIKMPVGTAGDQAIIGDAVARADKAVGFDNSGNLTLHNSASVNVANAATSESNAATSAATASTSATNSSNSATNSATSATAAANSATAAATSATNAATSETNSNTSAVNSATSESNASTSATAAANSATNAANSVTAAASSEGNSAASATNAATSASSASTSATNAATSATAAAASEANAATSATSAANSAATISTGTANGVATLDANVKVVERLSYENTPDGVVAMDHKSRVSTNGYLIPAISYALPIPAANIVDHDFFDNTQDAAWIDQCADKSWETEHIALGKQYLAASYANDAAALAANPSIVNGDVYYTGSVFNEYGVGVTTRAGSRKFPMRGVATVEAARVIIWDITSGQPEMWMVFNAGLEYVIRSATPSLSSVAMLNGNLLIGDSNGAGYGLPKVSFVADMAGFYHSNGWYSRNSFPSVADRNTTSTIAITDSSKSIVNNTVNSVAITYLPDAPLDDYGMRVPTIAVGCGTNSATDGLSVIKHDGTVVSFTRTGSNGGVYYGRVGFVQFVDILLYFTQDVQSVERSIYAVDVNQFNTNLSAIWNGAVPLPIYAVASQLVSTAAITVLPLNAGGQTNNTGASLTAKAYATDQGLYLLSYNHTTPSSGMVAYLTNTYNTGWMVGDIRRAFLCNSLTADRSVKGGVLTVNGTITETVNAGGVNVYSGFSAANYLNEAHSGDFDFGVGDFSISCWFNFATVATKWMMGLNDTTNSGGSINLDIDSVLNKIRFIISDDGLVSYDAADAPLPAAGVMHHSVATRKGSTILLYIDGLLAATAAIVNAVASLSNPASQFTVAKRPDSWTGAVNANDQYSLVRISATAPTAEQIRHMYETERKLFEPNAQALLSNSASVSNLRYDKKSGMYAVTNGTNTDLFKDLARVDSAATGSTIATPVTTLSGNRVLAPAVDIGSELAAQVKPDKHSIIKAIAAVGGVVSLPMGYKPLGCYDVTGAALVRLTTANTAFDGFIHSVTGLTGTQTYDITLEAV